MRTIPILLILALSAASCGGPPDPLDAGVKEYPTDILIGASEAATPGPAATPRPPPDGVGAPLLVRPQPRTTAAPEPVVTPEPRPDPCPEAHPFTPPTREAGSSPPEAPEEGTYPFRNGGEYEVTADGTETGTYPDSEREIRIVAESATAFEYESTDSLGVTIRYRIVLEDSLDPQHAQGPGAYITEIRSEVEGGTGTFEPTTSVQFVAFPMQTGNEQDATGVSPTGDTVMTFHSQVGRTVEDEDDPDHPIEDKARVDACGTVLQGWWIELTDGRVQGPGKDLSFSALYAFAPQYGMLPILEEIEITGTDSGAEVSSTRRSVISKEPKVPS